MFLMCITIPNQMTIIKCGIISELYIVSKMSSGRVGLKRYIIPITFDIFKLMWSMCLLHLRSEDIHSPRKLISNTLLMPIALIFKSGCTFFFLLI